MKRSFGFILVCVVATGASTLAGCATVALDSRAGRDRVSQLVAERTDRKIDAGSWPADDGDLTTHLRELLAGGLDRDKAVEIALLNNRDLRALYTDLDVAQSDVVQATLLHNPVLDASAGLPVAGGAADLSLAVAVDVIDLLYAPLRRRVADARFDEAKLRVAGEVLDLAGRAETAFFRHQADAQMLEIRKQVAGSTGAGFELARRMRQAGNVTALAVATQQALAEEAALELRDAEISVRESGERLNGLMGLSSEQAGSWKLGSARLPDPLDEPLDAASIERRAVERSLDLAAAEKLVVAAGEALGLDRASALFPEVVGGARGARAEGRWLPGPTLSIPIPLFDRGQARVVRARAELERARELYASLDVKVRVASRIARDRLVAEHEQAHRYAKVLLPIRETVVRETELQYNAMQIGPLDLLRAKEQQIETAAKYVEKLRDYWIARADLGLILAGRLPAVEVSPAPPTFEQLPRLPFPTVGP